MWDREKEGIHTVAGKGATTDRQTNKIVFFFFLSGDGEWHIDGPVVVGRYTHTRQRWLRVKIVKSNHDRHYKEALAMCWKEGRQEPQYWKLEN